MYLNALKALSVDKSALILDLGCGSGTYPRLLGSEGFHHCIGMDYAQNTLAQARKRDDIPESRYLCGDIYSMPFKDGCFHHVSCIGVFQSLTRPEKALREIYRILRPGAPLILITLNRLQIKHLGAALFHRSESILVDGREVPRLEAYNPFRFRRQLENCGFDTLDLRPVQIFPKLPLTARPILSALRHIPFLSYLGAVAFMVVARRRVDNAEGPM